MTHDELENLIYERTRCFVDAPVADCIFDLIAAEREACAKVCESLRDSFLSPQYATGQPMSSIRERFAAGRCAELIRARSEA